MQTLTGSEVLTALSLAFGLWWAILLYRQHRPRGGLHVEAAAFAVLWLATFAAALLVGTIYLESAALLKGRVW